MFGFIGAVLNSVAGALSKFLGNEVSGILVGMAQIFTDIDTRLSGERWYWKPFGKK